MKKRGDGEQDFDEAWRRLAVRYAYHWECSLEEVYEYLLVKAIELLARAIFTDFKKVKSLDPVHPSGYTKVHGDRPPDV